MPSTYSPNLRIELIATGEQAGTWGTTTNTNLGTLIEDAVAGYVSVSITSADQALTANNGSADQSRNMVVNLTTTTSANFNVYIPPAEKVYIIRNSSAYQATIFCSTVIGNTTAAGTGVAIPAGRETLVFSDATNVVFAVDHLSSLTLATDLAVADGGTGISSATAYALLCGGTTSTGAFQSVAGVGSSGQVLTSNGAGALPSFQTINVQPFGSGTLMLFQQTSAPTGWTKQTTHDNKALRVVSGSASSGGSVGFTTAFASQTPAGTVSVSVSAGTLGVGIGTLAVANATATGTLSGGSVGNTTLATSQIPSHTHPIPTFTCENQNVGAVSTTSGPPTGLSTGATGGGGAHNHGFTAPTFSGTAHNHSLTGSPTISGAPSVTSASFSGNAINLAVQYVDLIIASKD
jgi:hypothetical protein